MPYWLTFWPLLAAVIVGAAGVVILLFALWLEQFTRRGYPRVRGPGFTGPHTDQALQLEHLRNRVKAMALIEQELRAEVKWLKRPHRHAP